jgi:hypothetical protein
MANRYMVSLEEMEVPNTFWSSDHQFKKIHRHPRPDHNSTQTYFRTVEHTIRENYGSKYRFVNHVVVKKGHVSQVYDMEGGSTIA